MMRLFQEVYGRRELDHSRMSRVEREMIIYLKFVGSKAL